jgi:endoglucanase
VNEEFDGTYGTPNTTYYSNINAYNQIFVDTVRQTGGNNSARWLLIPGWNTSIDYVVGDYGFVLPTDNYRSSTVPSSEKRIMISDHYYTPWDFCGDTSNRITQYGATATDPRKTSTWGQEDYLDSEFKSMYDKFVTQGYPVVVGEFGAIDKTSIDSTNNTYRAAFAKAVCEAAKKYGSVPVVWDNGANGQNGMGLFDRNTYAVTQQGIIDAIMSGIAVPADPIPPTAPTNLTVTGSSSTSVSLSWGASTDNIGVTGYNVYNGTTLVGTATATTYTVTGLRGGTAYTFTVKAKDATSNLSAASNSVTVTTPHH